MALDIKLYKKEAKKHNIPDDWWIHNDHAGYWIVLATDVESKEIPEKIEYKGRTYKRGLTTLRIPDYMTKDCCTMIAYERDVLGGGSLKERLKKLREMFETAVEVDFTRIHDNLCQEMMNKAKLTLGDDEYVGYCGDGLEETIKTFISNQLIKVAIDQDNFADWDGQPRAELIEEYIDKEEEE